MCTADGAPPSPSPSPSPSPLPRGGGGDLARDGVGCGGAATGENSSPPPRPRQGMSASPSARRPNSVPSPGRPAASQRRRPPTAPTRAQSSSRPSSAPRASRLPPTSPGGGGGARGRLRRRSPSVERNQVSSGNGTGNGNVTAPPPRGSAASSSSNGGAVAASRVAVTVRSLSPWRRGGSRRAAARQRSASPAGGRSPATGSTPATESGDEGVDTAAPRRDWTTNSDQDQANNDQDQANNASMSSSKRRFSLPLRRSSRAKARGGDANGKARGSRAPSPSLMGSFKRRGGDAKAAGDDDTPPTPTPHPPQPSPPHRARSFSPSLRRQATTAREYQTEQQRQQQREQRQPRPMSPPPQNGQRVDPSPLPGCRRGFVAPRRPNIAHGGPSRARSASPCLRGRQQHQPLPRGAPRGGGALGSLPAKENGTRSTSELRTRPSPPPRPPPLGSLNQDLGPRGDGFKEGTYPRRSEVEAWIADCTSSREAEGWSRGPGGTSSGGDPAKKKAADASLLAAEQGFLGLAREAAMHHHRASTRRGEEEKEDVRIAMSPPNLRGGAADNADDGGAVSAPTRSVLLVRDKSLQSVMSDMIESTSEEWWYDQQRRVVLASSSLGGASNYGNNSAKMGRPAATEHGRGPIEGEGGAPLSRSLLLLSSESKSKASASVVSDMIESTAVSWKREQSLRSVTWADVWDEEEESRLQGGEDAGGDGVDTAVLRKRGGGGDGDGDGAELSHRHATQKLSSVIDGYDARRRSSSATSGAVAVLWNRSASTSTPELGGRVSPKGGGGSAPTASSSAPSLMSSLPSSEGEENDHDRRRRSSRLIDCRQRLEEIRKNLKPEAAAAAAIAAALEHGAATRGAMASGEPARRSSHRSPSPILAAGGRRRLQGPQYVEPPLRRSSGRSGKQRQEGAAPPPSILLRREKSTRSTVSDMAYSTAASWAEREERRHEEEEEDKEKEGEEKAGAAEAEGEGEERDTDDHHQSRRLSESRRRLRKMKERASVLRESGGGGKGIAGAANIVRREERRSKEHESKADRHFREGTLHFRAGRHDRARKSYLSCLKRRYRDLGPDHIGVSLVQERVGDCAVRLAAQAWSRSQPSGEGADSSNGDDNPSSLLIDAHWRYLLALNSLQSSPDDQTTHVARVTLSLGDLMSRSGCRGRALTYYEKVLRYRTEALGENHDDVAVAARRAAGVHDALAGIMAAESGGLGQHGGQGLGMASFHCRDALWLSRLAGAAGDGGAASPTASDGCEVAAPAGREVGGVSVDAIMAAVAFDCDEHDDSDVEGKAQTALGNDGGPGFSYEEQSRRLLLTKVSRCTDEGVARVLGSIAAIHRKKGEKENAVKCLEEKVVFLGENLPDNQGDLADCTFELGMLLYGMDKYGDAVGPLSESAALQVVIKDNRNGERAAITRRHLFTCCLATGDLLKAADNLKEYLGSTSGNEDEVETLCAMGIVRCKQYDLASAIDCYIEALHLEARRSDQLRQASGGSLAHMIRNLQTIFHQPGRFAHSKYCYEKARDCEDVKTILQNLGIAQLKRCGTSAAEGYLTDLRRHLNGDGQMADADFPSVLRCTGNVLFRRNRFQESILYYEQTLAGVAGAADQIDVRANLGMAYLKTGETAKSSEQFEHVLRGADAGEAQREAPADGESTMSNLVKLLKGAKSRNTAVGGRNDPLVLRHLIGLCLCKEKCYDLAARVFEAISEKKKKSAAAANHLDSIQLLVDISYVHLMRGANQAASAAYNSATAMIQTAKVPGTHPLLSQFERLRGLYTDSVPKGNPQTG